MAKVVFSEKALLDLDAIESYIGRSSYENASKFILQLEETFHLLAEMPLMGRARDDLREGIRMFVYRRYVILYSLIDTPIEDGIVIERVASPYQNYEGMFGQP